MTAQTQRIAQIIEEYDQQGSHRTGTATDTNNAHWLAEKIKSFRLEPKVVGFSHSRLDAIQSRVQVDGRICEGVPLFDCTYTDSAGVTGKLGLLGSAADIIVAEVPPNLRQAEAKTFMAVRQHQSCQAMIALGGGKPFDMPPGFALVNAEAFNEPFGPPVLQVPGTVASWLLEAAKQGKTGHVILEAKRTAVEVFNVEAHIPGKIRALPPLVVMTPRSGWWQCASERGGGLAGWLEIMRTLQETGTEREVRFVATTGHELGHLGLEYFLQQHPKLVKNAHAWIHLGANLVAAKRSALTLQASDRALASCGLEALKRVGITPEFQTPLGARAVGEAQNIFDGDGRFLSLLGSNELFHHPQDRWPDAVNLEKTACLVVALVEIGTLLGNR